MIPGLSWPETRIKPVNCEIFSLGIGSDYPLLALSEVSFILMSAILNLEEISVRRGDKTILGPLSWQVLEGQRWVVLGPNGAGKTTLLQICASLIHPTTGKIEILGQQLGKVDVFELRTRIGLTSSALVEQLPSDELVIDAVLTAAYAVLGRWQEKYDLWDESRAMALLTALGVRELGEN